MQNKVAQGKVEEFKVIFIFIFILLGGGLEDHMHIRRPYAVWEISQAKSMQAKCLTPYSLGSRGFPLSWMNIMVHSAVP